MVDLNKNVTWKEIYCPYSVDTELSPSGSEKGMKSCMVASQIAQTEVLVGSTTCYQCSNTPYSQTSNNKIIKSKASMAARAKGVDLLESSQNRLGEGVGTEVHKMIPKFLEQPGCKCKDMARKMNLWGPDGCENNKTIIVNHLCHKAETVGFLSWVPKSATRMVVERMVTSAIVIQNEKRRGVWWNWIDSLKYGLENTDANIFMTVQDDSMFHPDSKSFAEKIMWPDERTGFISLYTPKHYSVVPKFKTKPKPTGVNRVYSKALWGACAMVWPRAVVEAMMEHPFLEQWYGAPTRTKTHWERIKKQRIEEPWRIQNSDTAIGKLMNKMERSMWFVDPSPVNHVSLTSATGHGDNKGKRNCGRCAEWNSSLFKCLWYSMVNL